VRPETLGFASYAVEVQRAHPDKFALVKPRETALAVRMQAYAGVSRKKPSNTSPMSGPDKQQLGLRHLEEPKVRRLSGGGGRIRTCGSGGGNRAPEKVAG